MKDLGLKTYRFSVAWPRVFPQGTGTPNPKGLDFYNRLVDELLAANIQPYCTLFHWDLPQALEDKGGWQSRDTSEAFANYAGYVAEHLSDRVKHFMTMNEMSSFVDIGYRDGRHAPGLKLPPAGVNQVRHHAVLAHGLAVQAIRAHAKPGTKVGLAENASATVPVIETPEHIAAAAKAYARSQRRLPHRRHGRQIHRRLPRAPRRRRSQIHRRRHEGHRLSARLRRPQRLHPAYVRADDSPRRLRRRPATQLPTRT